MKRIALFIGDIAAEYQYRICGAVSDACRKNGIRLTVFHNFTAYGTNIFHSYGERSVMRIPNLKNYDGFLVAPDVLGVEGMRDELLELLEKEASVPVICLREEDGRFYNILVDDYTAMSRMVEHFIVVHGLDRICFMKGRKDLKDARIRYQAYLDIMRKHHLPVTEHMTFDGDYWKTKGDQAVEWFWDTAPEKPQAIVCANDYMAMSVQDALQKRGVRIPEDVRVSGFDDREEARFFTPSISSMHVEDEQLAGKAIEMFLNIWEGRRQERVETVLAEGRFRESCGCMHGKPPGEQLHLFQTKEYLQNAVNRATYMHVDYENISNMEDMLRVAAHYLRYVDKNMKLYVCLCDEKEKQTEKAEMAGKFTEHMLLYAILHADRAEFYSERFSRETILPAKYLDDCDTMYINVLHDKNDCLGYFVVTPGFSDEMRYFYQLWVQALNNSVVRQMMYLESRQLAETVDRYSYDELTGIPNRRKLDYALKNADMQMRREGNPYFIISIDMDGLKYINDHFGHVVGDEALCALADILNRTMGEDALVARTGGDEFFACWRTDDDALVEGRIGEIRDIIAEYNRKSNKEYELSASIGYAKCEKGMMPINCVKQADEMMYREKRSKKTARAGE